MYLKENTAVVYVLIYNIEVLKTKKKKTLFV